MTEKGDYFGDSLVGDDEHDPEFSEVSGRVIGCASREGLPAI